MRTTRQGQVHFYHIPTGVSTWHDPRLPKDFDAQNFSFESLGPLPPGKCFEQKNGFEQISRILSCIVCC